MSFSFGNTSQPAFGSTPAKATGFGAPLSFGGTPATSASTGFGGFGSTFGNTSQQQQQQQQTPAFGTSFGTPAPAATAPAFGSAFGTPSASAAPAFGTSFGTPATSAPVFGTTFGAPASSAPAFGTAFGTPVASSAPGIFGSTTRPSIFSTPSTSAPTLFSTSAPSTNIFGSTTTSTPSLFGQSFGTTTTATGSSLFGTNTSSLGGTGGAPSFGIFGNTSTTSTPSLFSGFGTTTTTGTTSFPGFSTGVNFGGFGTGTNQSASLFGTRPTATGVPVVEDKNQQILASFYAINLYGDERDDIIKKWNMLQACWGTGKGYYNSNQPPVEYDHRNPFFRFKTIGYVVLPSTDNSDGYVKLLFHKKESEISSMRDSLITGIGGILGNKPNLNVKIEHIKPISDDDSEVMITVSEKGVTGTSRKILASDLTSFLSQPAQKQQLTNVGVYYIGPFSLPSKAQIHEYLKSPPPGIDTHMWQAAQTDNPKPDKYLPTAMNSFTDLKRRMLCEEYETAIHRAFLVKVNNEINELKRKHAASIARITEQKQKFLQLQHRVLRILVKQEVTRKVGLALQPEEEVLRSRFEMLYSHLTIPSHFRGQLNEWLTTVKMMNVTEVIKNEKYKMDAKAQDDIKQFLKMEQEGISHLINIINKDIKDLKIICEGLTKIMPKH